MSITIKTGKKGRKGKPKKGAQKGDAPDGMKQADAVLAKYGKGKGRKGAKGRKGKQGKSGKGRWATKGNVYNETNVKTCTKVAGKSVKGDVITQFRGVNALCRLACEEEEKCKCYEYDS